MRRFAKIGLIMVMGSVMTLWAEENRLSCAVLDDGVEKVQCTFVTPGKNAERTAVFYWHSDLFPQDDREHTATLRPGSSSIYDYRYLRGRAEGQWTVTVTLSENDTEGLETSHRFTLKDGKIAD